MDKKLIEKLAPYRSRLIKLEPPEPGNPKSGKRAVENRFQLNPYSADDPEILDWIESGGNFGILLGEGLIAIDADDMELFDIFPPTFTVKSGSARGGHRYYRSNIIDNAAIFDNNGANVGNVQAKFKYCVGPGSKHWSGGTYEIIDDSPIEWLSLETLEKILSKSKYKLEWAKSSILQAEKSAKDEAELIGFDIPIEEIIDLKELKQIGISEWQGAHPIHGSTTGQNFNVNTSLNVWHCFRCNSGGGPLSWLAVREGLMQCHESQKGKLRGPLFIKTLEIARGMGYKIGDIGSPETLPPSTLQYFNQKMKFIPSRLAEDILTEINIVTMGSLIYLYDKSLGIYRERGDEPILQIIYDKLGEAYRDYYAREALKIVKFKTAIDEVKELRPELIAVENGILNVLTRELMPFTPDIFIMTKLPMKYDPTESSAEIERFLTQVVSPEDAETLQEFSGYCLLKSHKYRKGVVLFGPTQSGKTTFTETLRTMLGGTKNVASTQLHDILNNRFASASLYGKLGNFAPELDDREVYYTGKIRALTGADTFTAEFKNRDSFQFISYAKQLYNCNKLPKVDRKESIAFFGRFELIPFPNQFIGKKADSEIQRKLTTPKALSGMLNWCLEGLNRLVERDGFRVKMGFDEVKERYLATSEPTAYFIENWLENDGNHMLPKDQAYEALCAMCKKYGAFKPSKRELGLAMLAGGYHETKISFEGQRVECWQGVTLCPSGTLNDVYTLCKVEDKWTVFYIRVKDVFEGHEGQPRLATISVGNRASLSFPFDAPAPTCDNKLGDSCAYSRWYPDEASLEGFCNHDPKGKTIDLGNKRLVCFTYRQRCVLVSPTGLHARAQFYVKGLMKVKLHREFVFPDWRPGDEVPTEEIKKAYEGWGDKSLRDLNRGFTLSKWDRRDPC